MDTFEQFWRAYPLRVGKKKALLAYRKAIKEGATHAELLAGVERYIRWIRRMEKEDYIAHPTTWLNQGRWMDEDGPDIPKAQAPAAKPYEPERPLSDAERQKVASMFDGLDSRLKPRRA